MDQSIQQSKGNSSTISTSSTTRKIRSSKVVTKSMVTTSKVTKVSAKNLEGKLTTHESKNLLSETTWASNFQEGNFSTSQHKSMSVAKSSTEMKEHSGLKIDVDQRALHLMQGARPKTSSSLLHSKGLESHLDPSFSIHKEIKIPPIGTKNTFNFDNVWDEGFSMFPEYFQDFHSGVSSMQSVQRPIEMPLKETKLLTAKQYSWEKIDNTEDEESEAEKIANSWLKIFGENEPFQGKKDLDRKAIKNS
ncbi:predicted protein [Nematostella vectensis]|uniref:Uncharacterized protein n=1 Tax=Nematostella vectensis TaxID=45351 RepID=A7SLH7_NEMVE|nr:predicted protein [Nematostella vectensis]|eukprot:XP_001627556.1 predicted protein [Nematostella vectensis]